MGKPATERRLANNEASAHLRSLRASPRKLNLLAGMLRGLKVEDALVQLTFSPKALATDVKKLLQSAVANAENNHQLDVDKLYISEILVGKGLVMKRIHARARGRAFRIHKPFSNITITVREREVEAKPAKKAKAAKQESK